MTRLLLNVSARTRLLGKCTMCKQIDDTQTMIDCRIRNSETERLFQHSTVRLLVTLSRLFFVPYLFNTYCNLKFVKHNNKDGLADCVYTCLLYTSRCV